MDRNPVSPALARVAERFASRLPARLADIGALRKAIAADDDPSNTLELQRVLHDLAGTAEPLGYAALGQHARRAEKSVIALRDGQADRASLLADLDLELAEMARSAANGPATT